MNELNFQQLEVSLEFGLGYQFLTSFINLHQFNRGPTLRGSSHAHDLETPPAISLEWSQWGWSENLASGDPWNPWTDFGLYKTRTNIWAA